MPFESIAVDYFNYAGVHYLVVVDILANWIEVMKTPPASIYSGSKDIIMLLSPQQWSCRTGSKIGKTVTYG